jgi:hypothetical protein
MVASAPRCSAIPSAMVLCIPRGENRMHGCASSEGWRVQRETDPPG